MRRIARWAVVQLCDVILYELAIICDMLSAFWLTTIRGLQPLLQLHVDTVISRNTFTGEAVGVFQCLVVYAGCVFGLC